MDSSAPGSIAGRLRSLRNASGRSLADLARELGVHFTTVSSWERGRSRPNYPTLARLAGIYQVSPEYFLEEFASPGTVGRLTAGPTRARFQRIGERDREDLVGGLEEIRFLLVVTRVVAERAIRPAQLEQATGIPLRRIEALLGGEARPTVSEVLHLSDALGIRIEERPEAPGRGEPPPDPAEPERLVEAIRSFPPAVRPRLVRLLSAAVRLALAGPSDGQGGGE